MNSNVIKHRLESVSVSTKMVGVSVGMTLLVMVFFGSVNYFLFVNELNENNDILLEKNLEKLEYDLALPLWNIDNTLVQKISANHVFTQSLSLLRVTNNFDKLMYEAHNIEEDHDYAFKQKVVFYEGEEVGIIEIAISTDQVKTTANAIIFSTCLIIFAVTISVYVASIFLSRTITRPITYLKESAEKITSGDFNSQITTTGSYEIVKLSESMEQMRLTNKTKLELFEETTNIINIVASGDLTQKLIPDSSDSAEIKKLKTNMNYAIDQLTRLESDRSAFSAMITHEMKTPLVPIKGYCQMLLKETFGKLTDEQKDAIQEISTSSDSLYTLIENILSAQKSGSGQSTLNITAISSSKILDDVFTKLSPIMIAKNIEFKQFPLSETLVLADHGKLIEILTNLIQNAVDFVPEKSGKIEISCTREDDGVLFSVKDNGIGMSSEQQKKLFTKFYQVDTSATRKHGGTGLGLSICKGFVESMGGKIWVKSEPSHGSVFYFTIPLKDLKK